MFGSKNLKAIAARGVRGIPIHDPLRLLQSIEGLRTALNTVERVRDAFKSVGTLGYFSYYNRIGLMPFRNNQFSMAPREKAEVLNSRWYAENLAVRALTCSPSCISGCSGMYKIKGDGTCLPCSAMSLAGT